jgi:hypothetical protein
MRAEWRPGWYELDQPLEVGRRAQFAFFPPAPDSTLVFYNTLWRPKEAVAARGTVTSISHPALGHLQKVETDGLDYTFVLADGTRLVVDAEEEPGQRLVETAGGWERVAAGFDSWTLIVEIADLEPLQPAPDRLEHS